jgi:hypothetical protein
LAVATDDFAESTFPVPGTYFSCKLPLTFDFR